MCRFVLYLGPPLSLASLTTAPAHSIVNQSIRSREAEEPLNGDGFGVAWYVPEMSEEPAVFRSVTPAWNNRNLLDLARVTRSGCILAHVRAATQGLPVTELNCHPFTAGRHAFMHNGDVGGFSRIRRTLRRSLTDSTDDRIQGSTDSEHVFAMFLDRLAPREGEASAVTMARALESAIKHLVGMVRDAGVTEPTYLNLAASDGKAAVACRYTTGDPGEAASLYLDRGRRYVCEEGVCRMVEPGRGQGAVIIASEPLGEEMGWQVVPANHMVVVRKDRSVEVRPFS
ncbi:MAG: class II glutamine amidotransferase [Planctomycetaceae bacterium]